MILFLTTQYSGSSDCLMEIFEQRKISAFRFNFDLFDKYKFEWNNENFTIIDPMGREVDSQEISTVVCYKALLVSYNFADFESTHTEGVWLKSQMNYLYCCMVKHADERHLLHLWQPLEERFPKTWQMLKARKYFAVPDFKIFWGHNNSSHAVIVKTLAARPLSDNSMFFAQKTDLADLDPAYPWFTQEIADGNRDATVVYINGKVHCYQFASERGSLTDWRVTQGTDANQWSAWDAGTEFEEKIRLYMKELGLKFGRLDFIIGGKEPQFLEVNPCGQFGWLDDEKLTLHNEVVDAILDQSSTVYL